MHDLTKSVDHRIEAIHDKNSNFSEDWDRLRNLLRTLQNFTILEINEDEVILSPLGKQFKHDLQKIVNECSFFTRLSIYARISNNKVYLTLIR